MKKLRNNQQGMTSILFATVFVAILSLIVIAFALLVRNDQRQTLDKTLSYQAQYAAESVASRKANEVLERIEAGSYNSIADDNTATCSPYNFEAGVEITCLTWNSSLDFVAKDTISTTPFITKLETSAPTGSLKITWKKAGAEVEPPATGTYGSNTQLPQDINADNFPILRITTSPSATVDDASTWVNYLVPSTANGSSGDGAVIGSSCIVDVLANKNQCSAVVPISALSNSTYVSIIAYGSNATLVSLEAFASTDGTGASQKINGSQVEVDVNAKAQDVVKRIRTRVSVAVPQTWAPAFAASAQKICKDIKIDGTNTSSISGGPVCPAP